MHFIWRNMLAHTCTLLHLVGGGGDITHFFCTHEANTRAGKLLHLYAVIQGASFLHVHTHVHQRGTCIHAVLNSGHTCTLTHTYTCTHTHTVHTHMDINTVDTHTVRVFSHTHTFTLTGGLFLQARTDTHSAHARGTHCTDMTRKA